MQAEHNYLDSGIIYIATNLDYLKMACASALSLSIYNPNKLVLILSSSIQSSIQLGENISIETITVPDNLSDFEASRWLKTQLPKFSYFDRSLYIDSDVLPLNSIQGLLQSQPISMGLAYHPTIEKCAHIGVPEKQYTLDFIENPNFPQYNSGVILFDRSNMCDDFFDGWHSEWLKYKKHDQLALARSISQNSWKINELQEKYNCPSLLEKHDSVLVHFSGISQKKDFWQNVESRIVSTIEQIF